MVTCEARNANRVPVACGRVATWVGNPLVPAVGHPAEPGKALHLLFPVRTCGVHQRQVAPAFYFDIDAQAQVWAALRYTKPDAAPLDWDRAVFLWNQIEEG